MRAFFAIRSADQLFCLSTGLFTASRTKIYCPAKLFSCQPKADGSFESKVMNTTLLVAAKEEAKALLTSFLKKQGLSNAGAAKTIKKSDLFVDHLVSRLHCIHKSQDLVGWFPHLTAFLGQELPFDSNLNPSESNSLEMAGSELTTLEIRSTLIPYLEALIKEHGNLIVDVVETFPSLPVNEKKVGSVCQPNAALDSKKLKVMSRISKIDPARLPRPQDLYLMELGMDLEQIKGIIRKFPAFAYYSLKGKIQPLVEFLVDLGITKSEISTILSRRPQLCGISLYKNLIPSMVLLESLGVDRKQWAKVIYRSPSLLCYSKKKVESTVEFLHEMDLSAESVGKVLTYFPNIVHYSVETKLRPTAEYFNSLGVDVAILLHRCPQIFSLSLEGNLKPMTQFFLERGYSNEEVGTMLSKFSNLYALSLSKNLIPKWEFFLTMNYSKSVLVQFPHYFGYSLEKRIKPRYARVKKNGVAIVLSKLLSLSNCDFEKVLEKEMNRRVAYTEMSCSDDNFCSKNVH